MLAVAPVSLPPSPPPLLSLYPEGKRKLVQHLRIFRLEYRWSIDEIWVFSIAI